MPSSGSSTRRSPPIETRSTSLACSSEPASRRTKPWRKRRRSSKPRKRRIRISRLRGHSSSTPLPCSWASPRPRSRCRRRRRASHRRRFPSGWPRRFWSVGPALAETLFDAGLRRATVEQYQASFNQAVANYRGTVLTAFQQVEDNLAAMRILAREIQQQDTAVESAARNLRLATAPYRAVIDPYLN